MNPARHLKSTRSSVQTAGSGSGACRVLRAARGAGRTAPAVPRPGQHARLRFVVAGSPAFTLMELVLAMGITALVLVAINGVFFSAMRLRESTTQAVDESLPAQQALVVIRRDLECAMPPYTNGVLSGDFKVGSVSSTGLNQPVDIELYTATGALHANEPWGEVQRVTYALRLPSDHNAPGKELVRSVTRNLLATIIPTPQDQALLTGVQGIEYSCYDGLEWRDYWDTTITDTNLPSAVRVRIQLTGDSSQSSKTLEIVVPIDAQPRT